MPGVAIHLELASGALKSWIERPGARPFPPEEGACRDAFLLGSLAPDLGYFPGGDRLLSDLAHYLRPSGLARDLIDSAATDRERAFAWGWATHVLADAWIHPLINQGAAERASGRRLPGLTYADDPAMHVRVEQGLDAFLPAEAGWPDPPRLAALRGPDPFGPLARAYSRTYGITPSSTRLAISHRIALPFFAAMLARGRALSGRSAGGRTTRAFRALGGWSRRIAPGGLVAAMLDPLPPQGWLLAEAGTIAGSFADRFRALADSGLGGLPDINLDTGEVEADPPTYGPSAATLRSLESRRPARKDRSS